MNLCKRSLPVIKKLFVISILMAVILAILSCSKLGPGAPASDQTLDGTVDGLTFAQVKQHARGDVAFTEQVFTEETVLCRGTIYTYMEWILAILCYFKLIKN